MGERKSCAFLPKRDLDTSVGYLSSSLALEFHVASDLETLFSSYINRRECSKANS